MRKMAQAASNDVGKEIKAKKEELKVRTAVLPFPMKGMDRSLSETDILQFTDGTKQRCSLYVIPTPDDYSLF